MNARPQVVGGYADESDDAALRALLRETPMRGAMTLSLEREPSWFGAAREEGGKTDVIRALDPATGRALAMAARTVRECYVDGVPRKVGYLGQLRLAEDGRHTARSLLRLGFRLLESRRGDDELPYDFTSIAAGNHAARSLLEAGLPGLPEYRPMGRLLSLVIRVPSALLAGSPRVVGRGLDAEITDFRRKEAARHQFAPCGEPPRLRWQVEESLDGSTTGCAALWDQRAFKQAVVGGYGGWLRAFRMLLGLPKPGKALPMAFLSHFSVANDDSETALAVVDRALGSAGALALRWLALGLCAEHPCAGAIRARFSPWVYETILYQVAPRGYDGPVPGGRIQPEIALL